MSLFRRLAVFCAVVAGLAVMGVARADDTLVAVAANFKAPSEEIAQHFKAKTGDEVKLSFGPSGEFATQIIHGAPFAVFLSADIDKPQKLEAQGLTVPGTRATYAVGKLVLWSRDPTLIDPAGAVLKAGKFEKLAIADPALAPYGAAAIETLTALGLKDQLAPKLVQGKSIAQALEFAQTGNAELGFVALSQVIDEHAGSRWVVPETLHKPIEQQVVLLKTAEGNKVARAFLDYLHSSDALAIIDRYGYARAP